MVLKEVKYSYDIRKTVWNAVAEILKNYIFYYIRWLCLYQIRTDLLDYACRWDRLNRLNRPVNKKNTHHNTHKANCKDSGEFFSQED